MKKNGVKTLVGLFVLSAAFHAFGVAAGSCMKNATALQASQTVTLVDEYDPELKEYYGSGVRYYKITLQKGKEYTIWMNGGSAAEMQLSIDVDWSLEEFPSAWFNYVDYANGVRAAYMYADSWSDDDPSSFTYYVMITGEIGQQTMLYASQAIMSFTQVGEEGNPKRLAISDTQVNDSASLIEGDYFYIATLEAGRKYMFRTTGGSADNKLGLSAEPSGDWSQEDIREYTNDVNNTSWYIYPTVTQDYIINVSGANESALNFKLKYKSYPKRLPGSHPSTKLREEDSYAATIIPGRVVADTTYYDDVIDESLCRVKLPAGEKWAFETVVPDDASNGLRMVVYDANGTILRENTTLGNNSLNCRAVISTTYDGWYYVGVCRPDLQYWDDQPTDGAITVFAYPAASVDPPDDYDTADDVYTGAELIETLPAAPASSVAAVGSTSGIHELNVCDWYDYFVFAGRAGVTYALKATFAGSETTNLKLAAKVYKQVNGSLVKVTDTIGSISPDGTDEVVKALSFTADASAMYYVRVSVSDGLGLDFPPYRIHAIAYMEDGTELGLVQAKTKGVDATWYFTDDATGLYSSGAIVAVPVVANKNIRFSAVRGYSTPPKTPVVPLAWTGENDSIVTVEGIYNDEFDPGDDDESGVVTITPAFATTKAKRTLWVDDLADWFRFKAETGYYYSFYLTDTTQGAVGDAVFSLKYYTDETNLVEGVTECRKQAFDPREKGKYNICVYHGTGEKADTAYRLYYQAVHVGTVKFATTTPNVSESADYVDVVVQRTASEGAVRVNYATEEYTARPGKEYYPTSGVLEWADGDMSDKVIRVRLIPDLEETWDEQLRFKIRLWPMTDDVLADDEYPAIIESDTATVKIKEMSTKNAGVVRVVDGGTSVIAGEKMSLTITRSGGSQGRIAVKVKTQPGTATADVDYVYANQTLVWEDGETGDKAFEIDTLDAKADEDRVFNIKMTARTEDDYADCETPEIAATKTYLTVVSEHKAGAIVLSSPTSRSVLAGETLTAVFRRVGGSTGRVAVKVKTQDAGAVEGMTAVSGQDFTYGKDYLVWEDGDTSDKTFEVATAAAETYGDSKTFRVKISVQTAGDYADCKTPSVPETKFVMTIVNRFAPAGDGFATMAKGYAADGSTIDGGSVAELLCGVKASIDLGASGETAVSSSALLAGSLPPGMSLDAGKAVISGVPTTPGDYSALVQVKSGARGGAGLWLDFHVSELGTAAGTFTGALVEDGSALAAGFPRVGRFSSFTVSEAGDISANFKVAGVKYKFRGKGFDSLADVEPGTARPWTCLATLDGTTVIDGVVYTNKMELALVSGEADDPGVLGGVAGTVKITLNILDDGFVKEVSYAGELVRDNSSNDAWLAAVAKFAGYYTVSLVPYGINLSDGVPCGNGYLTMTLDESGTATYAGLLADGTALSGSSKIALRGDLSTPTVCAVVVPIGAYAAPWSFGGQLKLHWAEDADGYVATVVDSRESLEWNKDGANSSYDGQGFRVELRPTGGWYNTIVNLQTYYLNRDFSVEAQRVDGVPAEMLPSGQDYTADTMPHGVNAQLGRTSLTPDARVLVTREDSTLYDLAASVNPWKVKTSFVPATGLLSGTFRAWSDGTTQAQFATLNHYGVLLMNRDEYSPLDEDVWTAGFYLLPVTSNWTFSLPFNIRSIPADRDWTEAEVPQVD